MSKLEGWYVYKDEDGDAIAVAEHGVGPNGGWQGKHIAKMPVPDKKRTRQEINDHASLIVRSVNSHHKLVEALEEARSIAELTLQRGDAAYGLGQIIAKIDSALASARGATP
jgi:hypothetical protein